MLIFTFAKLMINIDIDIDIGIVIVISWMRDLGRVMRIINKWLLSVYVVRLRQKTRGC